MREKSVVCWWIDLILNYYGFMDDGKKQKSLWSNRNIVAPCGWQIAIQNYQSNLHKWKWMKQNFAMTVGTTRAIYIREVDTEDGVVKQTPEWRPSKRLLLIFSCLGENGNWLFFFLFIFFSIFLFSSHLFMLSWVWCSWCWWCNVILHSSQFIMSAHLDMGELTGNMDDDDRNCGFFMGANTNMLL